MRLILLAALVLAGCATTPDPQPWPNGIAGNWRSKSGQTLAISLFSSFATQHGCTVTGGMLQPLGNHRYRIDRYETGFATDGCGPWRSGSGIAPFDGAQVVLERQGSLLIATGSGRRQVFRWISAPTV